MASRVFLDANVLLDFTLKRDDYTVASEILTLAVKGRLQAFITPSILHISGYWLTKAYGAGKAKELLLTLLADVQVIDLPHEVALAALNSRITDIEDALQYYAAMHHRMDYFISRDKALQKASLALLPVLPPEEFLQQVSR